MWVEKTKEGRYKFSERYEDPMTGKAKKVSVTLEKDTRAVRKEAAQILAEKIQKKVDGDLQEKQYTLQELTDLYFIHQKRSGAYSTAKRNNISLTSVMKLLGSDILADKLSARYINERLETSGLPAGRLNEYLRRLKAMLRWAYNNDYIRDIQYLGKVQPFRDIPHRIKIQDKYLEGSELEKVLADMEGNRDWQLVTQFLAYSGLRYGEFCALERSDVDLANLEIHVTKQYDSVNCLVNNAKNSYSIRDVHIQPELLDVCKSILSRMDRRRLVSGLGRNTSLFMFDKDGSPIHYAAYCKFLKDHALQVTGKNITPHALRHTHASLLYEAGFTIDEVARRLGHGNSKITREVYLHVTSRLKEEENRKLDSISFVRHA